MIVWTSTNGGESFNAGTIDPDGYSDKTGPSDALLTGSNLVIGAIQSWPGFQLDTGRRRLWWALRIRISRCRRGRRR